MEQLDAKKIVKILKKEYPQSKGSLNYKNPFELLVAVCLSAQCTDERVNKVTKELFKKYNTPEDFANADIKDIEKMIKTCGFYHNKAKNLKLAGEKIVKDFNGIVPKDIKLLQTIPGVGRKSANVIMCDAFNDPQGIAVDTHCKRLANRIGFSQQKEPTKIEQDLLRVIPKEYWKDINHLFIDHGRKICKAQNPKCSSCVINQYCKNYNKDTIVNGLISK